MRTLHLVLASFVLGGQVVALLWLVALAWRLWTQEQKPAPVLSAFPWTGCSCVKCEALRRRWVEENG